MHVLVAFEVCDSALRLLVRRKHLIRHGDFKARAVDREPSDVRGKRSRCLLSERAGWAVRAEASEIVHAHSQSTMPMRTLRPCEEGIVACENTVHIIIPCLQKPRAYHAQSRSLLSGLVCLNSHSSTEHLPDEMMGQHDEGRARVTYHGPRRNSTQACVRCRTCGRTHSRRLFYTIRAASACTSTARQINITFVSRCLVAHLVPGDVVVAIRALCAKGAHPRLEMHQALVLHRLCHEVLVDVCRLLLKCNDNSSGLIRDIYKLIPVIEHTLQLAHMLTQQHPR